MMRCRRFVGGIKAGLACISPVTLIAVAACDQAKRAEDSGLAKSHPAAENRAQSNFSHKPTEGHMSSIEPTPLPSNWQELTNSEKFGALRDSSNLVRGEILTDVEIDCRKGKIKERKAYFELQINYPTLEDGSFAFVDAQNRIVTGRLDVLFSDVRRYQRIFVLNHPVTFESGRTVPRALSGSELAHIASLLETHQNRCVETHGHHIEAFVILAKRER